jgi:3-(3-hydroxy-phenyl)propionate hydroxylase
MPSTCASSRPTTRSSRQPPFINIQQFYIEGFLVEALCRAAPDRLVDIRWQPPRHGFKQNEDFATLQLEPRPAYSLEAEHVIDCSGSRSPFRAWCGATVTAQQGDDRWCIADVRFKNPPPVERHTWIEAPFNENRAVWQHLMADDVWRIDYQMPPHARPEDVSREDVVRARLKVQQKPVGQSAGRRRLRDRLGRPLCLPQRMRGQPAARPRVLRGRRGPCDEPLRRARRQLGRRRRRQPGLEAGRRAAGPRRARLAGQLPPRAARGGAHNVLVTNRTARFLRPADGAERLFRSAALGLAREHLFARQLVNTGRMSAPNHYTRSGACGPSGGRATQNVGVSWPDGRPGELLDLLAWAEGRLLVLVFGDVSAAALARLATLSAETDTRCVQVVGPGEKALAVEHVHRPRRPPAGNLPRLRPRLGAAAARRPPRRHRRERGRLAGPRGGRRAGRGRAHEKGRRMKSDSPLNPRLHFQDADAFYESLLDAHQGLSREESGLLNARLILLMANQLGDTAVLKACIAAAKTAAGPGQTG